MAFTTKYSKRKTPKKRRVGKYADGGSVEDPDTTMRNARADMDLKEMQARKRFVDDGRRIPGRLKGVNDKNKDRPALWRPVLGREDD